ncbi:glycosyltransferase family 4 protein [Nocardioides sp. URHA0020]|uniref:glycosyltransferase family 4 protein n=1 Tax=Nocardioides sp. URHA0020 TaxID=1380392 RepID=UPI000562526A|nr:glycosyltransferase family 4 protein [Nocardioides sp. URHA0020]
MAVNDAASVQGKHVVIFSWRDTANPEGGGAELYIETIAHGLVARGARVTLFCASHDSAPSDETIGGVRYVRRGNHVTVYLWGLIGLALRRLGRVDIVVDVQNGLPFFTRLATRKPVVVLVHHVHREQWPVVYPGRIGKVGWWIERRLAPLVYRGCQYIAVSRATRAELADLGVDKAHIAVVHNGTTPPPEVTATRSPDPTIAVVGRLVPHKQVEHAVDAVLALREEFPRLRLVIVGDGWWADDLQKYVAQAGAGDLVTFEGHVPEQRKHEILATAWLLALPSLKEGWGIVIGEAGGHRVPAVAYSSAGGTRESIAHDRSGILVDDQDGFAAAVRDLLSDAAARERLGDGAYDMSHEFAWRHSQDSFARVLTEVLAGRRVCLEDPDAP